MKSKAYQKNILKALKKQAKQWKKENKDEV